MRVKPPRHRLGSVHNVLHNLTTHFLPLDGHDAVFFCGIPVPLTRGRLMRVEQIEKALMRRWSGLGNRLLESQRRLQKIVIVHIARHSAHSQPPLCMVW